ncbi:MAG TPA: APC family permease [Actinomycetota bacterium]|nr:APC family permease [Actinomycetota bacterium]
MAVALKRAAPPPLSEPGRIRGRSTGYLVKRALLGRPLATARLEHERLGKPTAMAVFSSDNMSSVAYATEEILRVLVPAVGLAAFSLVLPLSGVIVLVEVILIFSYRQTIKAYPSAGGAYIVTKDNLGLLPAQLAGVALLVDYVLTVSVSTAAGVQAISSVVPLSVVMRIGLSLFFVWLIAYGNLLGVRESGRIFAAPTYLFIGSLFLTCGLGLYQVLSGHLEPFSIPHQVQAGGLSPGVGAVALFVVLRAFASGGAAVTGVEAISNGVPAFRKPEWKNAQITLMWMGAILGTSFLAVSYLAHRLHVLPVADESKSVLAQIGQAVYGSGAVGHLLFLILQLATTLILILAANTSFADFPRLASFHAGDAFMPRQLTKRGHKLVFSSGIVALAGAASLIIVVFRASVSSMIPLYALGVFMSFTLSQSGMAKRHLRLREKGWRTGLFLNGLGALSTLVVTVIIGIVKFDKGAWMVVLFVPLLVFLLVRVNRIYEAEEEDLLEGLGKIDKPLAKRHIAVVLVDQLDEKTFHAVQYALTIHPQELIPIHLATDGGVARNLTQRWAQIGLPGALKVVPCEENRAMGLDSYLRKLAEGDVQITVIVPGPARLSFWQRLRQGASWAALLRPLRDLPNVSIVVVREHGGHGHQLRSDQVRISPRPHHVAVILVDRLDRSILKALRYARSIEALDIRALHAGVDPKKAQELAEQWSDIGHILGVPLDISECFDRDVAGTVSDYIEEIKASDAEITVVIPRRVYPRLLQRFLHDRTSRAIARRLADEPHVDVVIVPYRLRPGHHERGRRNTIVAAAEAAALPTR